MEKLKQKQKKRNGRSKSFTGGGLASFLRSTVASFSSTFPPSSRNNRSSFNHRNAFSGPIVSIVPPEARGKRRQPSGSGYRTPEPSSPKVSCIGQVKRCKSKRAAAKVNPSCGKNGGACPLPPRPKRSLVKRVLFRRSRSRSSISSRSCKAGLGNGKGIKGVVVATTAPAPAPPPAPAGGLGQMKRFTSGRAAFQDFDWREAQQTVDHDDYEEEDEGFVAHSAPLVLGGGVVAAEPKKEVNLGRGRPVAPPTPLQLPY
jgi:hypothetical protein